MSFRLANLFPEGSYTHQMGFQRGTFAEFFSPTADHANILAQRRFWLNEEPDRYAALLPDGRALIQETIELANAHHTLLPEEQTAIQSSETPEACCIELGRSWEPDFLLLHRNAEGLFHLVGGVVCFPSTWSLEEKIGRPMEFIHAPVPNLNQQIGRQIQTFLSKLRPDTLWLRTNWGLSASAELNQHPTRALPALQPAVDLSSGWLRVEHQALAALPQTGGVLFGIRISMHSLAEVKQDSEIAQRLLRAVETMPEELATYKRIGQVRDQLVRWLQAG